MSALLVSALCFAALAGQVAAEGHRIAAPFSEPVIDAVLQGPHRSLVGRVDSADGRSGGASLSAGCRVVLLHGGKVRAEAVTDDSGRFWISHLAGGTYAVGVVRGDHVQWTFLRLWAPGTAPPGARSEVEIEAAMGIVRGQGPLASPVFRESALVAAVVAGAVAAPVIYHNASESNTVPASP